MQLLTTHCPMPSLTPSIPALLPALAPPACLLAGESEKLKRPWLGVSTALQQLKHQHIISTLLILSQNIAFYQLLGRKTLIINL